MILFDPLRRRELERIKENAKEGAASGVKMVVDRIFGIWNSITKFRLSRRVKRVLTVAVSMIVVFLLSVYIPSWFSRTETEEYLSLPYDPSAVKLNRSFYSENYSDKDFDNDSLSNGEELSVGTDIFILDTDGDGFSDGYEVKSGLRPLKKDDLIKTVKELDKKNGTDISMPYLDDGVLLWAKSYKYKAEGYVIKDQNGYIIRNFKGWAQFPDSLNRYVYSYKNGKLKKLKYRENENAYYIKENCYVVVLDKEPSYTYRYTFCGTSYLLENSFVGNFLSFVLPSRGRTYMKCEKIPEIGPKDREVMTSAKKATYTNSMEERISKNTNSLEDLSMVWNTIKNGQCVYVSLFKEDHGESIGVIYGYDNDGNLLVADPETGVKSGKLYLQLMGRKSYDGSKLVKITWFEFEGLGFDSKNGDRINFFGKEKDSNYIDYLDQ